MIRSIVYASTLPGGTSASHTSSTVYGPTRTASSSMADASETCSTDHSLKKLSCATLATFATFVLKYQASCPSWSLPCTAPTSYHWSATSENLQRRWSMLGPLIRKNLNLSSVRLLDVSYTINLEQLMQALQSCSGFTQLQLEYRFEHGVSSRGLASMIRGLAYPRFQLRDLRLHVLISDAPDQGLALFEAGRDNSSLLFPDLAMFLFFDSGRHSQQSTEVFYLPVLREAAELKYLYLPKMSDSATAAAAAAIITQKPPLEEIFLCTPRSHPGFVDIIKTSRRTLCRLDAEETICCESMFRQLLPTNNIVTDLCLQMNLQRITITLLESPTVSALIQKAFTSLSNLKCFHLIWNYPTIASQQPARLQIRDIVATPWTCIGLYDLCLYLGSHTAGKDGIETKQERRAKIGQVYKQLGMLTQLKRLDITCDVLGGPSEVELDFTFETGVQAMEPCLKDLYCLDIVDVAGILSMWLAVNFRSVNESGCCSMRHSCSTTIVCLSDGSDVDV